MQQVGFAGQENHLGRVSCHDHLAAEANSLRCRDFGPQTVVSVAAVGLGIRSYDEKNALTEQAS
jgi:hypothetical protein